MLPRAADPIIPNYTFIRKDRQTGGGGGIAFLVHHDIPFTPVDTSNITDPIIETQAISITHEGSPLTIVNVYIPPVSSCPPRHSPDLNPLLNILDDALIVGDLNAHHAGWFSTLSDARGEALAADIENSPFCVLNADSPTCLPRLGNPLSPDVTLISAHLTLSADWTTQTQLNSDHLPITISFPDSHLPNIRTPKTFTNFRQADWVGYVSESEKLFSQLPPPTSCSGGEQKFREVINIASRHNIPSGFRKNFIPDIPREASVLINQRDNIRIRNPQDPAIDQLNQQISDKISSASKQAWLDKLDSADHHSDPNKFWSLLRCLSGKRPRLPPNQPISFGTKIFSRPNSIAKKFNSQFTSVSTHKQNPNTRRVIRRLRKNHKLDTNFKPFNPISTGEAIKCASNSSAAGPDGITNLHLKHLGLLGVAYLTCLFNLSVCRADIPAIWKSAVIIPILKPGKAADQSSSYRPISLLCPAVKILEKLLLPQVTDSLSRAPSQHGFAPFHSTTTALLPVVTKIAEGFNAIKPPSRSATVAIDISKAFDSVDHTLLLDQISHSTLHSNLVRWLAAYLRGRTASCHYLAAKSPLKIIHTGVPQGSVLSPSLFNYFVSDCPNVAELMTSYADDFTILESSPDL